MKAVILKELRENAKWALLAVVVLGLLMAYGFSSISVLNYGLVGDRMQTVTLFGFPCAGLALGLLQILQDARRGRWSFLIHRPIPRAEIFVAKVIVGVSLYVLCTGVPLALAIAWAATPYHIAVPFDWHMILPRLADLIGGLMWYFAGLLVAVRPARWVGSRLAPVGLALLGSFAAQTLTIHFILAVLIAAAAVLILFPAAWSAFVHDGRFESQPPLPRLLQTLSIAGGVAFALIFTVGIVDGILETAFANRQKTAQTNYQVQDDGQVIRVVTADNGTSTATDLQGNPLPSITPTQLVKNQLNEDALALQDSGPNAPDRNIRQRNWGLQSETAYLHFVGYSTSSFWFYVVGRSTIEGFDRYTRRWVGSIGPDGYVPAPQPPQPFPELLTSLYGGSQSALLKSSTAEYELDMISREITKIFTTSPQDPIVDGERCPDAAHPDSNSYVVIATRSTLHILKDDKELFSLPVEHAHPPYDYIDVARTTLGHFIFYYSAPETYNRPNHPPDWVVEADSNGNILRRLELPPLLVQTDTTPQWIVALVMLTAPPSVVIPVSVIHPDRFMLIEAMIIALASVVVTMRLMHLYDSSTAVLALWMAVNLLLGFGGILLLLSLREPVARRRCPSCGKQRFVSHELCEHCGEPFEKPKPEGIEVFEIAAS